MAGIAAHPAGSATPGNPPDGLDRPRIFLGLCEIAGYYSGLKQGLQELGIPCSFCPLEEHPYQYEENAPVHELVQAIRSLYRWRKQGGVLKPFRKLIYRRREEILLGHLLDWALANHDVFVFGYKQTFSRSMRDLARIQLAGKRVICIFHGTDSRPPYLDGSYLRSSDSISTAKCVRRTRALKKELLHIERHTQLQVVNPFSAHLHEREFVSFFALGIPSRVSAAVGPRPPKTLSSAVRVLHCPSHPESKGTARIRQVIAEMKARGFPIDYVEIIGQPNAAVQKALQECDFVVDQLYADTPMAGFAAEAAAWGKPAIVGSYDAVQFERIPYEFRPPSPTCPPEELAASIEKLVKDEEYRLELGRRAREFVTKRWNYRAVAERLLQLARGDVPQSWTCDPRTVQFLHGYGMDERTVRRHVGEVVRCGGAQALQLRDKPELEGLMLKFADPA